MAAKTLAPQRPSRSSYRPSGRRLTMNTIMTGLLGLAAAGVVALLLWILVYIAGQGLKFLGPEFLTQPPPGDPRKPAAASRTASSDR